MHKWAALFASTLLLGFAAPAAAYDVSYTPLTSSNTLTCPANASLNGQMCYCNVGYNMSGGQCVKAETPPPTQFDIYDDVLMTITVNDTMTCSQLGITAPVDKDMCQRYKATSLDKRSEWKSVPRPSSPVNGVANPWAPAGQQTLLNSTEAIVPTKVLPAPSATSSAATSTTATKPVATSTPEEIDSQTEKIGEALKKVLDDRTKPKPAPATKTENVTPNAPEDSSGSLQDATTIRGPSQALIELSKKLVADAAASADATTSTPEPQRTPPSSEAQTAQAAKAVDVPQDPPDFISRILGFFRWLF